MRIVKRIFITLLGISVSLILFHCSKPKEAPFFDGLYLEYAGKHYKIKYKVTVFKNGFKIIKTEEGGVLRDREHEYLVDAYGKVYKSSKGSGKGEFSSIWIPTSDMKIGDTFGGGLTATRIDKWKNWQVLVFKNPIGGSEVFYELSTGFLVGYSGKTFSGTSEIILVDTNAAIPVEEIKE